MKVEEFSGLVLVEFQKKYDIPAGDIVWFSALGLIVLRLKRGISLTVETATRALSQEVALLVAARWIEERRAQVAAEDDKERQADEWRALDLDGEEL